MKSILPNPIPNRCSTVTQLAMRHGFARVVMLIFAIVVCFGVLPASAIIDINLQMQLGNPSGATADPNNTNHYLVQRTVESLDFSDSLGEPVWASWDLTSADVGSAQRQDDYRPDTNLPPGFYEVTDNDYNGVGAIDFNRGHMCPSEDRTDTTNDNSLLFFMDNIFPQAATNNQGVWGTFEGYCRTQASAGNELLIICGPCGFGPTRIPSGKAVIATNTWKIAVIVPLGAGTAASRITATTRVISLLIPNSNTVSPNWSNYITSASVIETNTGFTFFTALSPTIASALRSKVDGQSSPAPTISSFTPTSGASGTNVVITGANFTSVSAVTFNNTAAVFSVDSPTQITATVPASATTGLIRVTTPGGTATSTGTFTVTGANGTPAIASFTPTNGPVGTSVVITGSNFTSATAVAFNGASAMFNVNSDTQITATVPANATIGQISVTGPGGTGTSTGSFTVNGIPVITQQPQGLTLLVGQTATFTVAATSSPSPTFQWRFNGTNLGGANATNLVLSNVQLTNAGNYTVVVSNTAGSVTSSIAVLTITTGSNAIIAQWNFNNTAASVTSPPATVGTGTITLVGGTTSAYVSGSGSTDTNSVNNAWNTMSYAAAGTGNKTHGASFSVSTAGWQNISVSWDEKLSPTAGKYYRLQYSTNGTTFVDGPVITMITNGVFESKTNSLAGLPGVDNNSNFVIRVMGEFESTAIGTTNANYVTTSTSGYSTGGTVRFDMMTISGFVIPVITNVPPPVINAAATGVNNQFSFTITGVAGLNYIVLGSTNLTSWTPLQTNTSPFVFSEARTLPFRFYRAQYAP